MTLTLKVTKWELDEPNKKATLYIKDTDDNPSSVEIIAMLQPIESVQCINKDVQIITFSVVNIMEQLTDVKDGDWLTHPLIIRYEDYQQ